jgi:hypothetical protein
VQWPGGIFTALLSVVVVSVSSLKLIESGLEEGIVLIKKHYRVISQLCNLGPVKYFPVFSSVKWD